MRRFPFQSRIMVIAFWTLDNKIFTEDIPQIQAWLSIQRLRLDRKIQLYTGFYSVTTIFATTALFWLWSTSVLHLPFSCLQFTLSYKLLCVFRKYPVWVLRFLSITFILYKIILFTAQNFVSLCPPVTKLIDCYAFLLYKYFCYEMYKS